MADDDLAEHVAEVGGDGQVAPLEAMRSVAPAFSTRRMVKEYVARMYAPALRPAIRQTTGSG